MAILEEAEYVGNGQSIENLLWLEGTHILNGGEERREAQEKGEQGVTSTTFDVEEVYNLHLRDIFWALYRMILFARGGGYYSTSGDADADNGADKLKLLRCWSRCTFDEQVAVV